MKVLLIGGGGREHALAWKLAQDPARPTLFCAPGNAGTAALGTNLDIAASASAALLKWAQKARPDLTVVGPEAPLCAGLVDEFQAAGLRVFGPNQAAAQLEGSKVFAKEIMQTAGVPTASAATFTDAAQARAYLQTASLPLVIKADGLAAGKGVIVCSTRAQAAEAIHQAMEAETFGAAGRRVLIEEFLEGEEVSVLAMVDGEHILWLPSAQDHKRALDGDQGPNTGGMGAYSPAPMETPAFMRHIQELIFEPLLKELQRRHIQYRGILYAGLMMTPAGPKVLEFNCRFGDPETQAILPRLSADLIPVMEACIDGSLPAGYIACRPEPCVCVVMAAQGYPAAYRRGDVIEGLAQAAALPDTLVFHAGTRREQEQVITAGGRVLGVTAQGHSLAAAAQGAYRAVASIKFAGAQYRRDIAARALDTI